jgi:hypothetical protein
VRGWLSPSEMKLLAASFALAAAVILITMAVVLT